MKYDYPVTKRFIEALKQEYRDEAIDKGNTWRTDCSLEYLFSKLTEEFMETMQARNRLPSGVVLSELVDQALVISMIFERLADAIDSS